MQGRRGWGGGGGGGGIMGACAPPPTHFKSGKKCPFFWAKVPHLKNEKSITWMNALFCWKESALFAQWSYLVKVPSEAI
jgi:hypothetical protein